MPQTSPKYPGATSIANPIMVNALVRKYGSSNVIWPIVLVEGDHTVGYIYERTEQNKTNAYADRRPQSKSGFPVHFLDYAAKPRRVGPNSEQLTPLIGPRYQCSYDYILNYSRYATVDLDYVWWNEQIWKGMELTTFFIEFVNRARAEDLIKKMNRRPSWRGPNGPHALRKIVDAADDLRIEFYMFCINSYGRATNRYRTNGNVYWFPLSHNQIDRLLGGLVPKGANFDTFNEFLRWM